MLVLCQNCIFQHITDKFSQQTALFGDLRPQLPQSQSGDDRTTPDLRNAWQGMLEQNEQWIHSPIKPQRSWYERHWIYYTVQISVYPCILCGKFSIF